MRTAVHISSTQSFFSLLPPPVSFLITLRPMLVGELGSYASFSSSAANSERPTPPPSVATMTPRESAELTSMPNTLGGEEGR